MEKTWHKAVQHTGNTTLQPFVPKLFRPLNAGVVMRQLTVTFKRFVGASRKENVASVVQLVS